MQVLSLVGPFSAQGLLASLHTEHRHVDGWRGLGQQDDIRGRLSPSPTYNTTHKQLDRLSRQHARLPGIFRRHGCIVSNAHAQSLSWLIPVCQPEPSGNMPALVDIIHQTQSYKVRLVWFPAYCQLMACAEWCHIHCHISGEPQPALVPEPDGRPEPHEECNGMVWRCRERGG